MRPTRLSSLLLVVLAAGVGGYLLAILLYDDLPPLPRYAPVTVLLLALFELVLARVVRERVQRSARPGARPLHPLQVARAAALAKASSPTAALLLGGYVGFGLWLLPSAAEQAGRDAVVSGLSALAALLLGVAALRLERACRTPDSSDDLPGLGSRA